eukprot:TRINITY_DN30069_c0_g1_i1.p1 TRINITY_DN30069_c0_g1~~TRINITY_DN30069_c0_g1_i1.p1  ORF type:complete len:388 (+),score=55.06 TRINITY_DN30069_c0_g1_i1:49-1212(+)
MPGKALGRSQSAPHIDWPLSAEEKKGCILQLFDRDVRAANDIIRSHEEQLKHLQLELTKTRTGALAESVDAAKDQAVEHFDISSDCDPDETSSAAEKLRAAMASAAAALKALECKQQKLEASAPLGLGSPARSRSEGPVVGILAKESLPGSRCSSLGQRKKRVSFGKREDHELATDGMEPEPEEWPSLTRELAVKPVQVKDEEIHKGLIIQPGQGGHKRAPIGSYPSAQPMEKVRSVPAPASSLQHDTKLSTPRQSKLDRWREAKAKRDYGTADRLRAELRAEGIDPDVPLWKDTRDLMKQRHAATASQHVASADQQLTGLRKEGVDPEGSTARDTNDKIQEKVVQWRAAKAKRQWALADKIRNELRALGVDPDPRRAVGAAPPTLP